MALNAATRPEYVAATIYRGTNKLQTIQHWEGTKVVQQKEAQAGLKIQTSTDHMAASTLINKMAIQPFSLDTYLSLLLFTINVVDTPFHSTPAGVAR